MIRCISCLPIIPGKEERKIAAEKKDKDPILFGTFQDRKQKVCVDRFYYLGDWVDEYCDLTLDQDDQPD